MAAAVNREAEQSFLFCDVCNVQATSEYQYRSHLLGQKHWYNVRQKEVASRSIYVRGLPPSVTEGELANLFQTFGNIHTVILDSKGLYSIIEYTDIDSALAALRYPHKLTLNNSSLTIKPRQTTIKQSKPRPPKCSNDSTSTDPDDEDPFSKLKLQPSDVEKIRSAHTIDDQIQLLSSTQSISSSDLAKHEHLLTYLQTNIQTVYPSCHVLPFGSIATGLATPTSDLDVAVITDWSAEDEVMLGGGNEHLFRPAGPELIEQSSPLSSHDITPTTEDVSMETGDCTASSSLLSASILLTPPITTPPNKTVAPKFKICGSSNDLSSSPEEYQSVLDIICQMADCTNILSLPNARCPIIHFKYDPLSISCDVSINTRLGLYNTKLLREYFNFDTRVLPLLHVLKAWARTIKVKRNILNSYALSLMLIYVLQRTTPPVLPNLQSPGPWRQNMEWYAKRGFSDGNGVGVVVDGWRLNYINPQSLLASENTSTIGELLSQFFCFYSQDFSYSDHVVAIHSPSHLQLSVQEAVQLSAQNSPGNLLPKLQSFKVSCFSVQDPVELSHNVTKSFTYNSLSTLREEMSKGYLATLQLVNTFDNGTKTEPNFGILKLFLSQSSHTPSLPPPPPKKLKTSDVLCFSLEKVKSLLTKVPEFVTLSEAVPLLDIYCSYSVSKLKQIVLQSLITLLEKELGFTCSPVRDSSSISATVINVTPPMYEGVTTIDTTEQRKRLRDYEESTSSLEMIPTIDDMQLKKLKTTTTIPSNPLLDMLDQYKSEIYHTVECTVYSNTWSNRRQLKRQNGSMSSQMDMASPPLLQLHLSLNNHSNTLIHVPSSDVLVCVALTVLDDSMANEFSNFFAFFKKLVLSS